MIHTSKVITKDRLKDLLFWDRLSKYKIDIECDYMASEYDFSEYTFINNETIVSEVHSYIDDSTCDWVRPSNGVMTLVSIEVDDADKKDDYFYLPTKEYESLTDISHQSDLVSNDFFNTALEFYKEHGDEYDYCGNIEDWSLPLTIFNKHIKRHAKAKFRGTNDLDHMLLWCADRWQMYLPDFKKHLYASVASEEQEYMYNKFFTVT